MVLHGSTGGDHTSHRHHRRKNKTEKTKIPQRGGDTDPPEEYPSQVTPRAGQIYHITPYPYHCSQDTGRGRPSFKFARIANGKRRQQEPHSGQPTGETLREKTNKHNGQDEGQRPQRQRLRGSAPSGSASSGRAAPTPDS